MLKSYIGTKIINAEPCERDGQPGYTVIYPDGYASWSPAATFEQAYREIDLHERQLLTQTTGEASVAAISDGERPACLHKWNYDLERDDYICLNCRRYRGQSQ